MAEDYLQTAFEIKTTCDELSRRLMRWHWEKKPGAHTIRALQQHLEQRAAESPIYYERRPALDSKSGWQQMDTTLCMRILLDSEEDAAAPLDLLGYAPKPGLARRACNGLRIARNAAAHAGARAGAVEACAAFEEAVQALSQAYEGVAFTAEEIVKYQRLAEEYSSRCGRAAAVPKSAVKEYEMKQYATGAERERAAAARSGASNTGRMAGGAPARGASRTASGGKGSGVNGRSGASSGKGRTAGSASRSAASAGARTSRADTSRSGAAGSAQKSGARNGRTGSSRSAGAAHGKKKRVRRRMNGIDVIFAALAVAMLLLAVLLRAKGIIG